MIFSYLKKNGKIEKLVGKSDGNLVRMINPSEEEIEEIVSLLDIEEDYVLDPLDEDERARVEVDDGKILIIIKYPKKLGREEHVPYRTSSIGIIITPDKTVIVSKEIVDFLDKSLDAGKIDIKKRSKMIFQLLHMNANVFLWYLKEIQREIDEIEEELNRSLKNKEIVELMKLEKGLVYFVTSLRSNEILLDRLLKGNVIPLYEEDRDILEDAIIDTRQAIDTANIFSDILAGMMDAYASIISNNLNIVMKVLAIMTIILEIPTVITSFYGMNVSLPLQKNPLAYLHIVVWSIVSIVLVIYWFKRKRWL